MLVFWGGQICSFFCEQNGERPLVFDLHECLDVSSIVEDTVPKRGHTGPGGSIPVRGHRNFASRRTHCCAGRRLQKRYEIRATVYEQARCYSAVSIVTECRAPGGCGARCYLDKQMKRCTLVL